ARRRDRHVLAADVRVRDVRRRGSGNVQRLGDSADWDRLIGRGLARVVLDADRAADREAGKTGDRPGAGGLQRVRLIVVDGGDEVAARHAELRAAVRTDG